MRAFNKHTVVAALLVLSLATCGLSSAAAQAPTQIAEVAVDYDVAWTRTIALAGAAAPKSLVVCGVNGQLEIFRFVPGSEGVSSMKKGSSFSFDDPTRTLCTFAPILDAKGPPQLITLTPKGVFVYAATGEGFLDPKAKRLVRRAKLVVRTSAPTLADFARDATGDGNLDLVVPSYRTCALWVNQGPGKKGLPTFKKTAEVEIRVRTNVETEAGGRVDELSSNLTIPDLDTRDVNGDGRPDLVVRQKRETSFHLQSAEGSIPEKPTSILNLRAFRDTTKPATVRPGYTLAGTERARYLMRDLDSDGIPDYVIAHRRKVWVFHGTKKGPQFITPSSIIKTADDLTAIWLANLDDDKFVDLLIIRVQVPTIGTLITGLLGSVTIDFGAFGYANESGRRFSLSPAWRRSLVFKLPSLTQILKNPAAILERFEAAGESLPPHVKSDFNGDGAEDLIMKNVREGGYDFWRGDASRPTPPPSDLDDILRRVLFEDDKDEWDIDRLVAWIESLGNREVTRLTDNRKPDVSWKPAEEKDWNGQRFHAADLDGKKGEELVFTWSRQGKNAGAVIQVLTPGR